MAAPSLVYRIDAQDRIEHVGPGWDDFALDNDGPRACSSAVLNRPLWDFVNDPTIQDTYLRLVRLARAGRSTTFRFRCDAPDLQRTFRMRIVADAQGRVTFASRLEASVPRPPITLLEARAKRGEPFVRVCSWCHSVAWPGEAWVPLEIAAERLQLTEPTPTVTHGICNACAAEVTAVIEAQT